MHNGHIPRKLALSTQTRESPQDVINREIAHLRTVRACRETMIKYLWGNLNTWQGGQTGRFYFHPFRKGRVPMLANAEICPYKQGPKREFWGEDKVCLLK